MLDIFFKTLASGESEDVALQAIYSEINKRRLTIISSDLDYDQASELFERVYDLSERLDKIKDI